MKHSKQTTFLVILGSVVFVSMTLAASRLLNSRRTDISHSSTTGTPKRNAAVVVSEQPLVVQAPVVAIDRQVIAGGGGTSTGGTLRLDGTVGEIAASNNMSGGSFTLSGGYWNTLDSISSPSTTAVQFTTANFAVNENGLSAVVAVIRTGDTTGVSSVRYATSDLGGANLCSLVSGAASSRCDYITSLGTITFGPNEASKNITVFIIDDVYPEGPETLSITLSNPTGAALGSPSTTTLTINDNDATLGVNPIDQAGFFVREHYLDFLNREPDAGGSNFWVNQITSCGTDPQCIEIRRINVSAAFFISIEFQETGYLVYRFYKSAFGNVANPPGAPVPVVLLDFLRDTQQIGQGVQVGIGNWEAQLEANKQAFSLAFVQRADFQAAFPNSMTAQQFVDTLNTNAGGVLSALEQTNLVGVLGGTPSDVSRRSQVLRAVAEDNDLRAAEFNKAFVMMQFFGYLRRNPNDLPDNNFDGYNFWLGKLDQFNGNFVDAEMVKAFIISAEYRHRFGP